MEIMIFTCVSSLHSFALAAFELVMKCFFGMCPSCCRAGLSLSLALWIRSRREVEMDTAETVMMKMDAGARAADQKTEEQSLCVSKRETIIYTLHHTVQTLENIILLKILLLATSVGKKVIHYSSTKRKIWCAELTSRHEKHFPRRFHSLLQMNYAMKNNDVIKSGTNQSGHLVITSSSVRDWISDPCPAKSTSGARCFPCVGLINRSPLFIWRRGVPGHLSAPSHLSAVSLRPVNPPHPPPHS